MKMQRRTAGITAAMLTLLLTGCSLTSSYHPEQSGIYLAKDGTVQSAEIESFDNSSFDEERYKEDELKSFVEENVSAYNKDSCGQEAAYVKDVEGLSVCIDSLSVKDEVAKLILEYASVEDYMEFNEADPSVTALTVYSAPEAVAAGLSLEGMVDADGNAVDTSSMQTSERYYVAEISGDTEVVVEGKIRAVSGSVTVTDKNTAEISGENVLILFK